MTEWTLLTACAALLCFALSIFGAPRYKKSLQAWAIAAGLLSLAFFLGPPIDRIAGASVTVVGLLWALRLYIFGGHG